MDLLESQKEDLPRKTIEEWTLAMILVHAKALMVTLVVMVSPVVYSGDDTAIDYRMREHWYRNGLMILI